MKCCCIRVANENKLNCTMKSSIATDNIAALESSLNHLSSKISSWKTSQEMVEPWFKCCNDIDANEALRDAVLLAFRFLLRCSIIPDIFLFYWKSFKNKFLISISQLHFFLCIHCIKWNVRRTNFNVLIKLIKKSTTRFKMKPWKYATLKMNTMMMICEGIIYHLTSYKTAVYQEWPLLTLDAHDHMETIYGL